MLQAYTGAALSQPLPDSLPATAPAQQVEKAVLGNRRPLPYVRITSDVNVLVGLFWTKRAPGGQISPKARDPPSYTVSRQRERELSDTKRAMTVWWRYPVAKFCLRTGLPGRSASQADPCTGRSARKSASKPNWLTSLKARRDASSR